MKGEAFQNICPARTARQAEIGKTDLKHDCVGARDQSLLSISQLRGEERTAVLSGFVYETSSPRDPLTSPREAVG